MADANTLEIFIKTFADITGITLTREQAQELTKELKKLGETTGEFAKETEGAGLATKEMNSHTRESRLLFSEINRIIPGLGHSIHEAFLGPIGAVIALVTAIGAVKTAIDEENKSLDDAGERASQSLTDGVANLAAAWDEAKKKLGEYQAKLAEAGSDADPTSTMVARQKQIDDARLEGIKKQIEALGKLEEADLRAHGGSPEAIAAVRQRTQDAIDSIEAGKELADLQKELAESKAAQAQLQKNFDDAKLGTVGPDARARDQETELQNLREANDPNAKKGGSKVGLTTAGDLAPLQNLVDRWKKIVSENDEFTDPIQAATAKKALADAQTNLATTTAALAGQRERQRQIEAGETQVSQDKAAADIARDNAFGELEKNKTRIGRLPGEIDQSKKVQSVKSESKAVVNELNRRDAETGMTLAEMGTKSHLNQSQILTIARELIEGQLTHADEIAGLKTLMAQTKEQTRAMATNRY